MEAGYRLNEAHSCDSLGYAEHHLGNFGQAACYEPALSIFRELGDRIEEARTLSNLGDTHQAAGQLAAARQAWRQALAIFDDLDDADADTVRAKLAGIG